MVVYTAEPGSATHTALQLLASWTAEPASAPDGEAHRPAADGKAHRSAADGGTARTDGR
jgi:hypothetical protein